MSPLAAKVQFVLGKGIIKIAATHIQMIMRCNAGGSRSQSWKQPRASALVPYGSSWIWAKRSWDAARA